MKTGITLLLWLILHGATFCDEEPNPPVTTPTSPPATQQTFTPYLISDKLTFSFRFKVAVDYRYDVSKANETAVQLKKDFSRMLVDVFKDSPGFNHIEVKDSDLHLRDGNHVTCFYTAIYNANTSLAMVKTYIINNVIATIPSKGFFKQGTIFSFKVNKTEMEDIVTYAANNQNKRCSIKNFHPCPREYACMDDLYLHCVHRCQHGNERLLCKNGGRCFVDVNANRTKCSCVETDEYIYSGTLCEDKVEKLALGSTYIIAIAAGGGGVVVIGLVMVLVVVTCRGRARTNKQNNAPYIDGAEYTMAPLGTDGDAGRNRSKLSLDGVSNNFYSDATDIRFLAGRSHSVLKDERGQEIYMYKPVDRTAPTSPSQRSSTDVDAMTSRPTSYHGDGYGNRDFDVRRPTSGEHYL